ncbi:uncharacterized protein LOC125663468 isoform X2 [Ostrea edulis]|uniref:uncharacterized protein LOC125663468 isoform X2 n=1 Tax=Ostrea edulis TaxID=37623 RepID=UPI0024AFAB94|nr:uncharacterized protein LOC125663468 isoform X2 [Ostrea edulis]
MSSSPAHAMIASNIVLSRLYAHIYTACNLSFPYSMHCIRFTMLRACIIGFLIFLTGFLVTEALYCLSCSDSVAPRHCHVVRKCSDGEVCFTESHTSENGVVVFDTGCASSQTCRAKRGPQLLRNLSDVDPHYHHSLCEECCSSNLCNTQGCGQQGYPKSRGPVCFNCPQVADATLCDQIRVCELNQACYLHREEEFGDTLFTSSCINKHACSSNLDIFGRRSLGSCSKCCLADLCNSQCNDMTLYPSSSTMTTKTTAVTLMMTTKSQTPASTHVPDSTGSRGREFLVLFMRNLQDISGNLKGSLTVYITTDNKASVNISSSPRLNANIKSAVDSSGSITSDSNFTFPIDLSCAYGIVEPKAVIIETSQPSTVTIFNNYYYETSSDGTLIIPTHKLSNQYLVSTTEPRSSGRDNYSQFAIAALTDRTDIKIRFKMHYNHIITMLGWKYGDGDVLFKTLNKFETLQVNSYVNLTGTLITSKKPIAVFSGNRCNYLLRTGCSHMMTQLPPTTELDHQFIVPPFYKNLKTLIQVVTPTQNTINVTIGDKNSSWALNKTEHKNFESNENVVLVSRDPILVTGFGMGLSHDPDVNPYMTVMPGVHQYLDFYKITVPSGYKENFICIICPAVSISNLQISGFSIDYYATVHQSSVYLDKAFVVRVFQVQNTGETFVISTTDKSKFGLIVYGHRANDGYGFSGNFVLP